MREAAQQVLGRAEGHASSLQLQRQAAAAVAGQATAEMSECPGLAAAAQAQAAPQPCLSQGQGQGCRSAAQLAAQAVLVAQVRRGECPVASGGLVGQALAALAQAAAWAPAARVPAEEAQVAQQQGAAWPVRAAEVDQGVSQAAVGLLVAAQAQASR